MPCALPSPRPWPGRARSPSSWADRVVNDHGVTVEGAATPEWDALVDTVRAVAAALAPDREPPRRPHAPHVSLGYAVGDGSNAELQSLLDTVSGAGPFRLRVDAAHLLAVHQNPDAGVFTWDPIDVVALRGAG